MALLVAPFRFQLLKVDPITAIVNDKGEWYDDIYDSSDKTYGEGNMKVTALHETNFQLNAGEFVAIVGPSGSSGKTTFNDSRPILRSFKWKDSGEGKRDHLLERKTDLRFREFGFILQVLQIWFSFNG